MTRSLWRVAFVLMTMIVPVLVSPGCVRLAEERADLDPLVGKAVENDLRVEVVDGLGAIRSFDERGVRLWAQAPVLDVILEAGPEASSRLELTVENVMPRAQLTSTADAPPSFKAVSRQQIDPTEITWTLDLQAGRTSRIRIAPPDAEADEPFRFGVLSDIQDEMDDVGLIFERMNQDASLRYVVSAGDITQNGQLYELEFFKEQLEKLDIPFYTTVGNHEIGPDSPEGFHEMYGRVNFQFRFRDVYFTFVDSANATIDPTVYGWLEEWLDNGQDSTHVFLTHIPPIDPSGVRNGSFGSRSEAAKLLNMLVQHDVDLGLYGHIHSYYAESHATIPVYISGGGGALAEKFDGIDRHYLTVDYNPAIGIDSVGVVRVKAE